MIQGLLINQDLDITPKRVVSRENAADSLSRGIIQPHVESDRVHIDIPADLEVFMRNGWKSSTLLGYNSAVKKFMAFRKSEGEGEFLLPISGSVLEAFCIWAGRNAFSTNGGKISSNSLRKYIAGLKAWHIYHSVEFPTTNESRINLLLKASAKQDALETSIIKKKPMMFWHMTYLWQTLREGDDFDKTILDLFIVAFWGLARLAELTYTSEKGKINFAESVLTTDVYLTTCTRGKAATLTIRNAKTGTPGTPQLITLGKQKHALCPVDAIKRRLAAAEGKQTSLFGYDVNGSRRHITRRKAVSRLETVLSSGGFSGLKGHSFRVGGASLRAALGMSWNDLCTLGRWKSDCYKLYIRQYNTTDLSHTRALLREFRRSWRRMGF
ncbi:uncharacterized protein PGTG_02214 [Puccinia graminis f. sp. tritici CRL 75-36-700-3]|uniref:Tyr recombinase domain-containing protein n=1 Tax=Puccinia graminis f. sp. tritici (strain CRL 75-36-700-3 / race SCCL) TaxID=418459 RepID=E3JXH8_PUCGT|nr:uncharacterized protein PGTG_02214 [Puccinia graminis f. sp. tritici CRL 75-36-700-3]EFP76753.2 hypothetical protein PGTG_02214 [Puccinia graminis f. sp. tritici CRL 75-36-700-3]